MQHSFETIIWVNRGRHISTLLQWVSQVQGVPLMTTHTVPCWQGFAFTCKLHRLSIMRPLWYFGVWKHLHHLLYRQNNKSRKQKVSTFSKRYLEKLELALRVWCSLLMAWCIHLSFVGAHMPAWCIECFQERSKVGGKTAALSHKMKCWVPQLVFLLSRF